MNKRELRNHREQMLIEKQRLAKRLREKYGLNGKVAKIIFDYAWSEGHSGGKTEVESLYETIVELYEEIKEVEHED